MNEAVLVTISGPALAFLLYENEKSRHEQEGFLIGDTSVIVTKTITDSDCHGEKRQTMVNVIGAFPCPSVGLFYNNIGVVDKKKLEAVLGERMKKVVGWFYYEPEFQFQLSVRRKIIHRELAKNFSHPLEQFAWCLLSSNKSQNESTHSFTHKFVRYYRKAFVNLPLHIDNLGESSGEYKPRLRATQTFSDLCKSLKLHTMDSDWSSIDKIQDKLQSEISATMKKLSVSEVQKGQYERELHAIKQQIEKQQCVIENRKRADALKRPQPKPDANLISILDTFCASNINSKKTEVNPEETHKINSETNVIDLTITDEDELLKKPSYSQIFSGAAAKNN